MDDEEEEEEEGGLFPFRLLINNGERKIELRNSTEVGKTNKRARLLVEKSTGLAKRLLFSSGPGVWNRGMDPPFAYGRALSARNKRGGEKWERKGKEKGERERGKNRGERSFQTNRGSIHPRYTAPRCRARVKQCARPFTEWKHGPAMRETWTEMRVALQRATASPANCFSLTGPKSGEIPRTCIT